MTIYENTHELGIELNIFNLKTWEAESSISL